MMPMRRKMMEGDIDLDNMDEICQDELDLPINMEDFEAALKTIQKSVSQDCLDEYKEWMD